MYILSHYTMNSAHKQPDNEKSQQFPYNLTALLQQLNRQLHLTY
ncbi:MAG: hypothetical protein GQF41_0785 [Candidatus Rifleibacterium amylolyticum]|nr:MAG: hypothetical protein GQF41_0785 [Candidatus Rifleibacterium amylolyticum]